MKLPLTPLDGEPVALVTHTIARISGEHDGDLTVHHARTSSARMTLMWGGMMMVFWSAEAAQGVLEGFWAARPLMAQIASKIPPPRVAAEPFAYQALALTWKYRPTYAVVPRQELSSDKRRTIRWIDIHMGPVTWQILDQAGYRSALEILRRAHSTAISEFSDGEQFKADPTSDDYTPPQR